MKTYECTIVTRATNTVRAKSKKEAWDKFQTGVHVDWGGADGWNYTKSTLKVKK